MVIEILYDVIGFLSSVIEEERKRQMFYRDQFDLAVKRLRVQKIRVCYYKLFLLI